MSLTCLHSQEPRVSRVDIRVTRPHVDAGVLATDNLQPSTESLQPPTTTSSGSSSAADSADTPAPQFFLLSAGLGRPQLS